MTPASSGASAPQVITSIAGLREALASFAVSAAASAGQNTRHSVALVPTMGALHEGHLSLVRRARELAEIVVVSIFVNPLQFGEAADLDRYPRTFEGDVDALAREGVHIVFAPSESEMYPNGPAETRVSGGHVATLLEGASRPGHFDGMLTVVAKLFNIVQPSVAVFGQKDAQQVFLVRRMVAELDFPLEIAVAPTVREADGLALSSRNRFLDAEHRAASLALSEALGAAQDAAALGLAESLAAANAAFGDHDAAALDYVVAVDPHTFLPVEPAYRGEAVLLIAAQLGPIRLIDNGLIEL